MGNDNNDVNQRDISNLAYKIEDVKKDIEKHTNSIDELNRRIQQVEKEHIKMSGKLDVISNENTNISNKIDMLSTDIKEDRISRDGETEHISKKLNEVVGDVDVLTKVGKRREWTRADIIAALAIGATIATAIVQVVLQFIE